MLGAVLFSPNGGAFHITTGKDTPPPEKDSHPIEGAYSTSYIFPIDIIVKEKPYFSDKRDKFLNLNGQVNDSSSSIPIFCRHIASSWITCFNESGGQVDYQQFTSKESIGIHISVDESERVCQSPGEVHFVENENWGSAILDILSEMKNHGDKFKALGVNTGNHSFALGFKIKNKPNGDTYVIYLYDPNHTATHQRAEYSINNQNEIKKLTANDFLDEEHKKNYGLASDGMSIFIDRHTPMNISSIMRFPNKLLHPKVINYAMQMGLTEVILRVTEDMQLLKPMSNERESLLAARDDNNYFGLTFALQNGHGDTIQAYGELLKKAGLNPDKTADILHAKVTGGYVSGLSLALQNGHANAIRVYGELLNANSAGFDHDKLVELLAAHSMDGAGHQLPALYLALQDGYADAVLAYGELLKTATLSPDETAILLAAKNFDNVPGLLVASNNGHSEAILSYGKLLNNACLTSDKTAELLAAKNDDGVPGLLIALQNGHDEVIRAYGQVVNDLAFNPTETEQLLAARCESGLTGLFLALLYGRASSVRIYGELLCSAGFTPYKISECLAAKGQNGEPGIFTAFMHGNADTMRAYADAIKNAGVTPEEVAEHLSEEHRVHFLNIVYICQTITL